MSRKRSDDRPRLWLVRQPRGLVPASEYDLDRLSRYRIGSHLMCTIEQPRDERLNRRLHGLINKVALAIGEEPESLKWWLKLECGLRRGINHFDGSTSIEPLSLSDLDQAEFSAFYDKVCEIIVTRIIPGADIEDLLNDAGSYTGLPSP